MPTRKKGDKYQKVEGIDTLSALLLLFFTWKDLHLSIKEKEHFCSCFLAYRRSSKHILFFMDLFYEELEGLCVTKLNNITTMP